MSRLTADLGIPETDIYPADYFDLIGGVGFGGLAALVLGHFRMSVDEAIDALLDVGSAIFHQEPKQPLNLELNTGKLRETIESILQRRDVPLETKMNDPDRPPVRCKVALYAASSARINHPQAFRTYPSRGSSLDPTIVEAICATMAISSHFSAVKIGPRLRQQSYVGGAVGANNPTRELLREASNVFGKDRRVAQIISIGSGSPHVLSLKSSTEEAGLGQLVKDLAVDCETVAQELHTRLYNVQAYLRLNVDRGTENVTMEDWSELGEIECHTGVYIAVASVSESLDTSLRNLRGKVGTITLGQLSERSIKQHQNSSEDCTLRVSPLCRPDKAVDMHGSPACHVDIFPPKDIPDHGDGRLWEDVDGLLLSAGASIFVAVVDASSSVSIRSDLQAWAQAAGDGHERDVWEDAIRMLTSIPLNERWLLIIDNADDPAMNLIPFIPKSPNLTVIITSRNRNLGDLSTTCHLELGEMEEEEALATLLHAARRHGPLNSEELKSAKTLAKELGYLAVALIQAGTYCQQLSSEARGLLQPYTFTQYLLLFYSHRAELMKKVAPSSLDNYQRGGYTTLDLSYQVIPQASRNFLHFLSFFHHTDIPLEALASAARKGFADSAMYLDRPDRHERVVSELTGLLAESYWSEGRLSAAEKLQLEVLEKRKDVLGLEHPDTILAAGNLSSTYWKQGRYSEAEKLDLEVLEQRRKTLGLEHPDTIRSASNLASTYSYQGWHSEAEKLDLEVLERRKMILGLEHPDTILATPNLSFKYQAQGRWSEAVELRALAVKLGLKVLGQQHPIMRGYTGGLVDLYEQLGQQEEAEETRKLLLS